MTPTHIRSFHRRAQSGSPHAPAERRRRQKGARTLPSRRGGAVRTGHRRKRRRRSAAEAPPGSWHLFKKPVRRMGRRRRKNLRRLPHQLQRPPWTFSTSPPSQTHLRRPKLHPRLRLRPLGHHRRPRSRIKWPIFRTSNRRRQRFSRRHPLQRTRELLRPCRWRPRRGTVREEAGWQPPRYRLKRNSRSRFRWPGRSPRHHNSRRRLPWQPLEMGRSAKQAFAVYLEKSGGISWTGFFPPVQKVGAETAPQIVLPKADYYILDRSACLRSRFSA